MRLFVFIFSLFICVFNLNAKNHIIAIAIGQQLSTGHYIIRNAVVQYLPTESKMLGLSIPDYQFPIMDVGLKEEINPKLFWNDMKHLKRRSAKYSETLSINHMRNKYRKGDLSFYMQNVPESEIRVALRNGIIVVFSYDSNCTDWIMSWGSHSYIVPCDAMNELLKKWFEKN